MASGAPQGANLLHGFRLASKFEYGHGARLPQAYVKFFKEWKSKPTAVHYIPKEGKWERDEKTGITTPIQNIPLPLTYPPEHHQGIWGGEGVVKGFQKRTATKKRVPHYWVPVLTRTVLHSVVMNKYWSTIVTTRTMDLIHENHGLDHYLLKTPACDLKSTLSLTIKRKILQALQDKCPNVDAEKRSDILEEYSKYLEQYTPEEIEWYGYSYDQAVLKMSTEAVLARRIVPQKHEFRSRLIQQLKEAGIAEAQGHIDEDSSGQAQIGDKSSWLTKMNPFGKKQET